MTQGQKRMWHRAERRAFDKYRAFNDIMGGPNPLTLEELEALLRRWPDRYGFLRAWVARRRPGGKEERTCGACPTSGR